VVGGPRRVGNFVTGFVGKAVVGNLVGDLEVGKGVGRRVGKLVGCKVGKDVGCLVGKLVRRTVGAFDVGKNVAVAGCRVSAEKGAEVGINGIWCGKHFS